MSKPELTLVYDLNKSILPTPAPESSQVKHGVLATVFLFLILKLPMIFVPNNPEELRDFDAFVKTSQGEMPYRDFVWNYGPISPLVYGAVLKVFPDTLLSVRLFSLLCWTLSAVFLCLLFYRYLRSLSLAILSTLFATGITGYPSYTHNHVLVTTSGIACLYTLLNYIDGKGSTKYLWISFAFMCLALFSRPVLMGYGIGAAWFLIVISQSTLPKDVMFRTLCLLVASVLSLFMIFFVGMGPSVQFAFLPAPWAILTPEPYPNLHQIVPSSLFNFRSFLLFIKEIRASLEVSLFYIHYFIWPAIAFTCWHFFKNNLRVKAAGICTIFGLFSSFDVLHYGFRSALLEQAMTVRGQFFLSFTFCSMVLLLWPQKVFEPTRLRTNILSFLFLISVGTWSYLPWAAGWTQIASFSINPLDLPTMTGIFAHPDRKFLLEAVAFINTQCKASDSVVMPQYDPGLSPLLKCKDAFSKDAYAFTRDPNYLFKENENPYAPDGEVTAGFVMDQVIKTSQPKFYLMTIDDSMRTLCCSSEEWQCKDFGEQNTGRRVCWKS